MRAAPPSHRSGHEALPHPAPTSGMTQRLSAFRICFRSLDKLSLSLCTEPVGLNQIPLGQAPFLHHLRQPTASQWLVAGPLFDGFPGTMGLSDCSAAFILELRPPAFSTRTGDENPPATAELSRFPYMVLTHMLQVSGSGELKPALALSHRLHIAFPTVVQGRRSRGVISEINTAPVRPSANASPLHH